MAGKFLTTQNKKIIASVALFVSAWYILSINGGPVDIPPVTGFITTQLLFGISLLTLAGYILVAVVFMIWAEHI